MTLLNCSVDKERLERGIKIAVKKEPHSYLSEILNETVTYPSLLPFTKKPHAAGRHDDNELSNSVGRAHQFLVCQNGMASHPIKHHTDKGKTSCYSWSESVIPISDVVGVKEKGRIPNRQKQHAHHAEACLQRAVVKAKNGPHTDGACQQQKGEEQTAHQAHTSLGIPQPQIVERGMKTHSLRFEMTDG